MQILSRNPDLTASANRTAPGHNGRKPTRGIKASLREASIEDYSEITALHARNGLATMSAAEWQNFWKTNPAYRHANRWPIGWVLESPGAGIVGSITNFPFIYHFQGRMILVAAASSWVTDPEFRGQALAMLECFRQQKAADLLISTTVSPGSEASLRYLQWLRIPCGTWNQSRYWIINHGGMGELMLSGRSRHLARLFRRFGAFALSFFDRRTCKPPRIADPEISIRRDLSFDNRFDSFWERLKQENERVLLARRDRETLSWHFQRHLSLGNLWIVTASRRESLLAFALFDRHDNPERGLKRLRIVDIQALCEAKELKKALLQYALHEAHKEGIHLVECAGSWLDGQEMKLPSGSHVRGLSSWMYYYKPTGPAWAEALANPGIWVPSSFDGDSSLGLQAKASSRHTGQQKSH